MAFLEVVEILEPFTVEVGNTPTKLFPNASTLLTYSLYIAVRSLGDASYVALGTNAAQEDRMTSVREYRGFEVASGAMVDAAKLFANSDMAADEPVLEISGLFRSNLTEV